MGLFSLQTVIDNFEEQTKDAVRIQRKVLHEILERNGGTEYLQSLGLGGRTDPSSFKACVPLVYHADIEPYIKRIIEGDSSPVLTARLITDMSLSSGTTQGKPKYVPFNEDLFQSTMHVASTSFAYRNREFPINKGKHLSFVFSSKVSTTTGGVTATTATMNILRGEFSESASSSCSRNIAQYCSPKEVIFSSDYKQSLYCHLLCGLLYSQEVQFIFSTFIHTIVQAFRTLEQVWEELCSDIRDGVLSSRITIPTMRETVQRILGPDPELADSIYNKCRDFRGNWYGVIPELWPNAKYVCGIMTGAMEPYVKKLKHYAGRLPLVSTNYGSSEGWIGMNVKPWRKPEETTFVVVPNAAYFEFLPTNGEVGEEPVGFEEVKVGEEYEVIVTSYAGLYRYRLGDAVQVTGFYNSAPEIRFLCRRNLLLTINIDKVTEQDLQLAVEAAAKLLTFKKSEVVDFTSYVDRGKDPGHYVIFWEINRAIDCETLRACCNRLDASFLDAGYMSSRKVNGIGPLELRVVKKGTFQKILEHSLSMGVAVNQFKMPRCIPSMNSKLFETLSENVIGRYFSTTYELK